MDKKRVVITGLGTVNPLGNDVKTTWENVLAGKSGIDKITNFDTSIMPVKIAGEVKNLSPLDYLSPEIYKKVSKLDKVVLLAAIASEEAIKDSGIDISKNPNRVGVIISTGIGGKKTHTDTTFDYIERGYKGISPYFIPSFISNMATGFVSVQHGIMGSSASIQTACASSNHALAFGAMNIAMGLSDVYVCGGSEYCIEIIAVSAFHRIRALSTRFSDTPTKASRPFDKNRDGFVIGEGSGVLVLEEYEHAKKRGAKIYCELCGFGMGSDAYDLVKPDPLGRSSYQTIKNALDYDNVSLEDVDYVNAHATSTVAGDLSETKTLHDLFGDAINRLHISSTKSMTGHLLGAVSVLEAIFCCLAIQDEKIPPNINLEEFDESITIPAEIFNTEVIDKPIKVAISNAFGFGGHNATVAFRKL